jgi:hypothetical protein
LVVVAQGVTGVLPHGFAGLNVSARRFSTTPHPDSQLSGRGNKPGSSRPSVTRELPLNGEEKWWYESKTEPLNRSIPIGDSNGVWTRISGTLYSWSVIATSTMNCSTTSKMDVLAITSFRPCKRLIAGLKKQYTPDVWKRKNQISDSPRGESDSSPRIFFLSSFKGSNNMSTGSHKPYAVIGAEQLTASVYKTGDELIGFKYRFNITRLNKRTGRVGHWFRPDDLMA